MVSKLLYSDIRFYTPNLLSCLKFISENYTDIKIIYQLWNSLNDNQAISKEWLIDHVIQYATDTKPLNILVVAGWFGLTGFLLKQRIVCDVTIVDKDKNCADIGSKLYPDLIHITEEIANFNPKPYDIIICTACEHLTDQYLNRFLDKKKKSTVVFLQSNNYNSIEDHINYKNNINEFADGLQLSIIRRLTLNLQDCERYMVIGR